MLNAMFKSSVPNTARKKPFRSFWTWPFSKQAIKWNEKKKVILFPGGVREGRNWKVSSSRSFPPSPLFLFPRELQQLPFLFLQLLKLTPKLESHSFSSHRFFSFSFSFYFNVDFVMGDFIRFLILSLSEDEFDFLSFSRRVFVFYTCLSCFAFKISSNCRFVGWVCCGSYWWRSISCGTLMLA